MRYSIVHLTNILVIATIPTIDGCELPDPDPQPQDTYLEEAVVSAWIGLTSVDPVITPDNPKPPTPDKPPTPEDCPNSCNNGTLGDGTVAMDCPVCDRNGDGDPDDPLPLTPPSVEEVYNQAEQLIEEEPPVAKTHTRLIPAYQAAAESKLPLIVIVAKEEPPYLYDLPRSKYVVACLHPSTAIPLQGKRTTLASDAFRSVGLSPPFIAVCPEVLWGETPSYVQLDYDDPNPEQVLEAIP